MTKIILFCKKNRLATLLQAFIHKFGPVKITCYILTLVVICLAVYPCSDSYTHLDKQEAGNNIAALDSSSIGHIVMDLCTPLCSCNCCGSSVQVVSAFVLNSSEVLVLTKVVASSQNFIYTSFQSIWQPPKLAYSLV